MSASFDAIVGDRKSIRCYKNIADNLLYVWFIISRSLDCALLRTSLIAAATFRAS
jgi:hypothetical protein